MQQAIRQIVKRETVKAVPVPEHFGNMVEIIVLPVDQATTIPEDSKQMMRLQEQTGFAKNALADSAEDVWNEV